MFCPEGSTKIEAAKAFVIVLINWSNDFELDAQQKKKVDQLQHV